MILTISALLPSRQTITQELSPAGGTVSTVADLVPLGVDGLPIPEPYLSALRAVAPVPGCAHAAATFDHWPTRAEGIEALEEALQAAVSEAHAPLAGLEWTITLPGEVTE